MSPRLATSIALVLGVLATGCNDERLANWQLRVTKLAAPTAFDPLSESATLSVTVEVSQAPLYGELAADFEISQGGGIPVRKLSTAVVARAGSRELEVEWDGTDETGHRLASACNTSPVLSFWTNAATCRSAAFHRESNGKR